MPQGPESVEEQQRLAEIEAMDLEAARPAFERICRLLQSISHTPLVHIGLVQSDTIWLAGVSDQAIPTLAREDSVADLVMAQSDVFWVEDAQRDERFSANPFLAAPYRLRFYAGAPIRLRNLRCIGALSISDRKPRPYDPELAERLSDFAAVVGDDCERRRVQRAVVEREADARAASAVLAAIVESAPVARNIDREKRAERAMAKALDAAEAANRAKSEFLANMSHEIRTPLNGVMGIAGALARTDLEEQQRELVQLIEHSAGVLDSLSGDVLDVARIESGRMALADEPFELATAIRVVAALFEAKAKDKGLRFEVRVAPAAEAIVTGDVVRLRQISSNLLSNAVKFTDTGKITVQVDATCSVEVVSLQLTVRDTGIGFDAKAGAKLFRRFEQADGSITRRFGGSGLGLAISRSLAEAMGGTLEAVSEAGKGSAFTLTLALPRSRGVDEAGSAATLVAEAAKLAHRPRVLLAEDHPTNRKVVSLILETVGVELSVVENGQDAVEAAASQDFDVILMDMRMPVMDGLSAIRIIRDRERATGARRTPILALTANAMPEHAQASLDAGADGHLSKPIAAAKLVEAVRTVSEPNAAGRGREQVDRPAGGS